VDLTKKTTVMVPLVFTGTAPAVDELGGILQRVHREVTIEGLPGNIPHELEIDLSQLKSIGDQILIKDISLPEGVSVIELEPNDLVASVLEPRTEKELSDLDEEVEEKIEEVEQVSKEEAEEESGEESDQAKEKAK
jgi:large subunit ribosomal protein L25